MNIKNFTMSAVAVILLLAVTAAGQIAEKQLTGKDAARKYLEQAEKYLGQAEKYFEQAERSGYIDTAIEYLTKSIKAFPLPEAYAGRGGLYAMEKKDFNNAISDLTEAIKLFKDSVPVYAYAVRGAAYLGMANFHSAIADLTEAIKLSANADQENLAAIYIARGNAYFRIGNFDACITDATESIKLVPSMPGHVLRASIYLIKGDHVKALEDANAALQIDPNNENAKSIKALAEKAASSTAPTQTK